MDYRDIDYRLKQFIDRPASNHLLSYISHQASLVIPCHHTNNNIQQYKSPIPPLPTFVNLLAKRSLAKTGTLLASLVLLDRLRQRLAQFARGMPCTCQRIFLATLIVTTKILHDTSPKNKHWTKYAVYFTLPEVNLMEKQLLALMNYRLVITEKDVYSSFIHYDNTTITTIQHILPPHPSIISSSAITVSTTNKNNHNYRHHHHHHQHDRHYLPKSASFNAPSSARNEFYKGRNNQHHHSLSNIILHQQQQPSHSNSNSNHHHKLKSSSKTTITVEKKNNNNNNKKRLYISTSSSNSSSSSLSSSTSMDDLLVVTPTNAAISYSDLFNNNKKHHHVNHNHHSNSNNHSSFMWLDPISQQQQQQTKILSSSGMIAHTQQQQQQQYYYYHGSNHHTNLLFKN